MSVLWRDFSRGLWKQLPPFRLVLGLCPTLAVTATLAGGVGMGLATTFVLVCSNVLISLLRPLIHPKVRIAVFITIIATFVVLVEMAMQAWLYPLYQLLGIFIPLIVVNCLILGRAEAFASKYGVLRSFADGIGMGLGFTLSLAAIGLFREVVGSGTLGGRALFGESFEPFTLIGKAPGAFITIGCFLAVMNGIDRMKRRSR
ncbi:MAG: electron transport complex subunit E [Chitinispirillaceae bacterium]|nr:electron transport complex subunit E [Chitinispirillaceae bacterium]